MTTLHRWRWTRRDTPRSTTWELRCTCGIAIRQIVRPAAAALTPEERQAFQLFRADHAVAPRIALPDVPGTERDATPPEVPL